MVKFTKMFALLVFVITATSAVAAAAELKTVTLSVDGMTCSVCPITVKKSLTKVDGVIEASAVYKGDGVGWATVSYDAEKTNVEALTRATENAGYPSHLKK